MEKTIVTENQLPDDAQMIHLEYDITGDFVDMFFISEKEGTEIVEGGNLYDVERTNPTFKRVGTIDTQRVKKALSAAVHGVMFKGYDGNSEKALIEMQNYVYNELGLE